MTKTLVARKAIRRECQCKPRRQCDVETYSGSALRLEWAVQEELTGEGASSEILTGN